MSIRSEKDVSLRDAYRLAREQDPDLAQRYYSNPFEWRVIWNANREVVEDPNWIYPDEVIVIPG